VASDGDVTDFTGGPDGGAPTARLLDVNGTLYGTTESGGSGNGYGTLFSYTPGASSVTTLINFSNANGGIPVSGLIDVNGTLYGTTAIGGDNGSGSGTLFSFAPATGTLTTLATFTGANGALPKGDLIDSGNTLYGTTTAGGSVGDGTLFSYSLSGGASVPEPASLALLSAGIAGMVFARRRRG